MQLAANPETIRTSECVRLTSWKGSSKQLRRDSFDRVRGAIAQADGSLAAMQAAAETIRKILNATSLTIILLAQGHYWDVIEVGRQVQDEQQFPYVAPYPTSQYPVATGQLLAHGGYLGADESDAVLHEYRALSPQLSVGSIMGAALVADAQTSGEIFVLREPHVRPFTREDLELLRDLATIFAARLPVLLAANVVERDSNTAIKATLSAFQQA